MLKSSKVLLKQASNYPQNFGKWHYTKRIHIRQYLTLNPDPSRQKMRRLGRGIARWRRGALLGGLGTDRPAVSAFNMDLTLTLGPTATNALAFKQCICLILTYSPSLFVLHRSRLLSKHNFSLDQLSVFLNKGGGWHQLLDSQRECRSALPVLKTRVRAWKGWLGWGMVTSAVLGGER